MNIQHIVLFYLGLILLFTSAFFAGKNLWFAYFDKNRNKTLRPMAWYWLGINMATGLLLPFVENF